MGLAIALNWNKTKDRQKICHAQISRFEGMKGYPFSADALGDLAEALATAQSQEQAVGVVTELKSTATSDTRCPTAAMIRQAIYDLTEGRRKALARCVACGGTGQVIFPMLVTYRGGYLVAKREPLRGSTEADLAVFVAQIQRARQEGSIGPEQAILSFAETCACRKMGRPIVREPESCSRCQDHGIYGGQLAGEFAGAWKWCDCAAGRDRMALEPELIEGANIARNKLLALDKKHAAKQFGRSVVPQILGAIDGGK